MIKRLQISPKLSYSESTVKKCLLIGTFYHPETRKCQIPFEEENCPMGQWLSVLPGEPGIVKCQKRPERFKDCQVVLGPGGELSCENEQPLLGYCDINRDIVRLPENFQRDTAPCPNDFSCRPAWNSLKNIKHQFISDLVCGEAKNSICLPDNGKTLTSLYNLLRSFELPKTACRRNPCPRGMAPTIEDGYYRCVDNIVELSILGYIPTHHCRRNRVYRLGRCRSRFFG